MFEILELVGALFELLELIDGVGRLIEGGVRLAGRLLGSGSDAG
ncbi:hypothetical protein [Longimicrobium sp.]|nr:hypothetical protein [Longimicrobium sp.]HSU14662.1 hypothetical protein [Longimicrobium sp.]